MEPADSLLQKYPVSLDGLIEEQCYFLKQIRPRYTYEKNERTNEILGYVYTATNIDTYDQINVLVEQSQPLYPIDKFKSLRAEGQKIFVQFEDATVRPYYNENNHTIQDSIKATNVTEITGM